MVRVAVAAATTAVSVIVVMAFGVLEEGHIVFHVGTCGHQIVDIEVHAGAGPLEAALQFGMLLFGHQGQQRLQVAIEHGGIAVGANDAGAGFAEGFDQRPANAAAGGSRWLGPLGGLAAGLGLAWLASSLGLSEEFGTIILIGLMLALGLMLYRRLIASQRRPSLQPASGPTMRENWRVRSPVPPKIIKSSDRSPPPSLFWNMRNILPFRIGVL